MYSLATRFLHLFSPEFAHNIALSMLRFFPVRDVVADLDLSMLAQDFMGLRFPHPLGLAAGFDKNAEAFVQLGHMGFSFLEVGSITPQPQPGNPKPRLFRLPSHQAIINRYGFNSKGMEYAKQRLCQQQRTCITGVNLGKNKTTTDPISDFLIGAKKLATHADYFVINVSSPNTPGLRDLQHPAVLGPMIDQLRVITSKPLLVKLSPDMEIAQETELADFLIDKAIDGIIVSNTTTHREGIAESKYITQSGGLSGPPLKDISTAQLARIYKITQGRCVLIGCGGISNGQDAYDKLRAGADLLQIYTAFVYQGPAVIRNVLTELKQLFLRDGVKNIRDLVGSATK
jgi:dihydroorotate dehydrogenase